MCKVQRKHSTILSFMMYYHPLTGEFVAIGVRGRPGNLLQFPQVMKGITPKKRGFKQQN